MPLNKARLLQFFQIFILRRIKCGKMPAQGVPTALTSSKESELQTTAALYAAGQIESLRAEGYLSDGETQGDCGEGLSLYRWTQSITSAGIDGLHQVEVVVENAK